MGRVLESEASKFVRAKLKGRSIATLAKAMGCNLNSLRVWISRGKIDPHWLPAFAKELGTTQEKVLTVFEKTSTRTPRNSAIHLQDVMPTLKCIVEGSGLKSLSIDELERLIYILETHRLSPTPKLVGELVRSQRPKK